MFAHVAKWPFSGISLSVSIVLQIYRKGRNLGKRKIVKVIILDDNSVEVAVACFLCPSKVLRNTLYWAFFLCWESSALDKANVHQPFTSSQMHQNMRTQSFYSKFYFVFSRTRDTYRELVMLSSELLSNWRGTWS